MSRLWYFITNNLHFFIHEVLLLTLSFLELRTFWCSYELRWISFLSLPRDWFNRSIISNVIPLMDLGSSLAVMNFLSECVASEITELFVSAIWGVLTNEQIVLNSTQSQTTYDFLLIKFGILYIFMFLRPCRKLQFIMSIMIIL